MIQDYKERGLVIGSSGKDRKLTGCVRWIDRDSKESLHSDESVNFIGRCVCL